MKVIAPTIAAADTNNRESWRYCSPFEAASKYIIPAAARPNNPETITTEPACPFFWPSSCLGLFSSTALDGINFLLNVCVI